MSFSIKKPIPNIAAQIPPRIFPNIAEGLLEDLYVNAATQDTPVSNKEMSYHFPIMSQLQSTRSKRKHPTRKQLKNSIPGMKVSGGNIEFIKAPISTRPNFQVVLTRILNLIEEETVGWGDEQL